jgi:hypothetical protein
MYGEEANPWYQIHTNGAVTTFARFYEGQNPEGDTIFYFEKMQADNVNNLVEVFGIEEYDELTAAINRVKIARTLAE